MDLASTIDNAEESNLKYNNSIKELACRWSQQVFHLNTDNITAALSRVSGDYCEES